MKFEPIQSFRQTWGLPDSFGVALFEPKDWAGLGSMAGSGVYLNQLKQILLDVVPVRVPYADILTVIEQLTQFFATQLEAINPKIGLRPAEVEFAVAGFSDVMQAVAFQLVRVKYSGGEFDFEQVYQQWETDGSRVSITRHHYQHGEQLFEVQMINSPYGRVGLLVEVDGQSYTVLDKSLACPAEMFMRGLCKDVAERLAGAMVT